MGPLKLTPLGFQQLSASNLSSAYPLTPPAGANVALLNPETANVRWRDDGVAPTATVGMLLIADAFIEYWGNLSAIQFILVSGSPLLNVSYYRIAG